MTAEYFFNQLKTPINWKPIGPNHTRDEITDEITVYGKVFDDWKSKRIIRVCFSKGSERCFIVERNELKKYKILIDCRAVEIDRINNFIQTYN
jgi:hypothetical protein